MSSYGSACCLSLRLPRVPAAGNPSTASRPSQGSCLLHHTHTTPNHTPPSTALRCNTPAPTSLPPKLFHFTSRIHVFLVAAHHCHRYTLFISGNLSVDKLLVNREVGVLCPREAAVAVGISPTTPICAFQLPRSFFAYLLLRIVVLVFGIVDDPNSSHNLSLCHSSRPSDLSGSVRHRKPICDRSFPPSFTSTSLAKTLVEGQPAFHPTSESIKH